MRGDNSGIYYHSVSCLAGGILVVYFCGGINCAWCVVYALLLMWNGFGKGDKSLRIFVFRLPKFIARVLAKFKVQE